MPYYQTPDTIERAVWSVLEQTLSDLVLVVVNDGASSTVWQPIAHIDDPRLIRFDLPENRGRYYADAVVLAATGTDLFTIHDSDDWSEPDRYQRLHTKLVQARAEVVFGGYRQHKLDGTTRDVRPSLQTMHRSGVLRHVAHHTAIYKTEALRRIGGPNPTYRMAWDTFMIGMAARELKWCQVPDPLYHHCHRPGSLMQDPKTSKDSPARKALWVELRGNRWKHYLKTGERPPVDPVLAAAVQSDADRLRTLLP